VIGNAGAFAVTLAIGHHDHEIASAVWPLSLMLAVFVALARAELRG